MGFNDRVYQIVRQIPEGKVVSYGQVAYMAGQWRASRAVGYALHRNPYPGKVPCHRVVFKDGGLATGFAFGGKDVQRHLLEAEGVQFTADGRVDMNKYCWRPRENAPPDWPLQESEDKPCRTSNTGKKKSTI